MTCILFPHLSNLVNLSTQYIHGILISLTPITNPLKKALHIELYTKKWFDKPLKISIPLFLYKYRTLKISTESVSPFPSVVEIHNDTNTLLHL